MKKKIINFKRSSITVLESKTIEEEVRGVNDLICSYNELCSNLFIDEFLKENQETITRGGIALSSKHAKDCLEDPIRTARFLKGVYKAISIAKDRFNKEKLTILYAGCGPIGTLIIPLLHLFSSNEIEVILLDIHQTSIDAVKKIIEKLNYQKYIKEYLVADATTYTYSKESSLHMIVTETMDKALTKEPQVGITENLGTQLTKNGIFIPEKIEIHRGYAFFTKEVVFNPKEDILQLIKKQLQVKKCTAKKLFSITSKIPPSNSFSFETDWISTPTNFEKTPDICLYTSVQIFDDIHLNESESYITNLYCVKSLYSIKKAAYKLKYTTSKIPGWKVVEK